MHQNNLKTPKNINLNKKINKKFSIFFKSTLKSNRNHNHTPTKYLVCFFATHKLQP